MTMWTSLLLRDCLPAGTSSRLLTHRLLLIAGDRSFEYVAQLLSGTKLCREHLVERNGNIKIFVGDRPFIGRSGVLRSEAQQSVVSCANSRRVNS